MRGPRHMADWNSGDLSCASGHSKLSAYGVKYGSFKMLNFKEELLLLNVVSFQM